MKRKIYVLGIISIFLLLNFSSCSEAGNSVKTIGQTKSSNEDLPDLTIKLFWVDGRIKANVSNEGTAEVPAGSYIVLGDISGYWRTKLVEPLKPGDTIIINTGLCTSGISVYVDPPPNTPGLPGYPYGDLNPDPEYGVIDELNENNNVDTLKSKGLTSFKNRPLFSLLFRFPLLQRLVLTATPTIIGLKINIDEKQYDANTLNVHSYTPNDFIPSDNPPQTSSIIPYDWTSIALDSNNQPHVAYCANRFLKYASRTESGWEIQNVVLSGQVGSNWRCCHNPRSLALDKNDYPHIAYYDNFDLKYVKWDGTNWVFDTVEPSGGVCGYTYCSLALDSNDNPCICYYDEDTTSLKYAYLEDSEWVIDAVDTSAWKSCCCLALDENDNPHIGYWIKVNNGWTNAKVNYATKDESGWHITTAASEYVGAWTQIALDSNAYPHMCYWNVTHFSGPFYLDYNKWDGGNWQIETFHDGIGYHDFGIQPSIAINSMDRPCISFQLQSRGIDVNTGEPDPHGLYYLEWDGSEWQASDASQNQHGDIGEFSSLALDSQDNPHISCIDTSSPIKYYTRENGVWKEEDIDSQPWTPAPTAPNIEGTSRVISYIPYKFKFTSTDPAGQDISYYIDWGDGNITDWTNFQASGTSYSEWHVWVNKGDTRYYFITAIAKNRNGYMSGFAYHDVFLPRDKVIDTPFTSFLQKHPLLFQILQKIVERLGLQS